MPTPHTPGIRAPVHGVDFGQVPPQRSPGTHLDSSHWVDVVCDLKNKSYCKLTSRDACSPREVSSPSRPARSLAPAPWPRLCLPCSFQSARPRSMISPVSQGTYLPSPGSRKSTTLPVLQDPRPLPPCAAGLGLAQSRLPSRLCCLPSWPPGPAPPASVSPSWVSSELEPRQPTSQSNTGPQPYRLSSDQAVR